MFANMFSLLKIYVVLFLIVYFYILRSFQLKLCLSKAGKGFYLYIQGLNFIQGLFSSNNRISIYHIDHIRANKTSIK